jgi:hypothetical protein
MDHHGSGSSADFKAEKRHEMVSRVTPLLCGGVDGNWGLLIYSAMNRSIHKLQVFKSCLGELCYTAM